jgi:SAM-dependent methyltransferase
MLMSRVGAVLVAVLWVAGLGCGHARLTEQDVNTARATAAMARIHPGVAVDTQADLQSGQRPTSPPYSGDLSIFEYPDRDKKLQIDRVMDLLHITSGKTVADIGAGSGWFTVRAARRVGSGGMVLAEDINPKATQYIDERAKKEKLGNIHTVLGVPDDARLPPSSVDAVLMLKVYHEIARPIPFMQALRASLRPGARVGIIDRNGNGTDHGLNQAIVEKEMAEAGYRKVAKYDFTKADGQDYFLIFEAGR